jgi:hypothetical protein
MTNDELARTLVFSRAGQRQQFSFVLRHSSFIILPSFIAAGH